MASYTAYTMPGHILEMVCKERLYQLNKWGNQDHIDSPTWLSIEGEEFGELCREVNIALGRDVPGELGYANTEGIRGELVQVVAVGIAWLEALDGQQRPTCQHHWIRINKDQDVCRQCHEHRNNPFDIAQAS